MTAPQTSGREPRKTSGREPRKTSGREPRKTSGREPRKVQAFRPIACGAQDFTIQNMVGSCDVQFPIRLEGLALAHSKFANVRPMPVPGLPRAPGLALR